ncbi:PP2C family protein-serine/threonine phosphatase [Plasticicumulans acidivorans]|uniref:Serine/threonine-protein phosphatase Stp1 n=1 Tax=Plasticicumulans acidivorans TaxID=886464 RepID=A0A317MZ14_9GAMM|nr:protein phosphatase 2C domain-containing protein [Plasticicumulans acidivorans]PWV64794.1 serine/threonine-protein phosphatase Stp1 [Plasticicumulans acidivorans]
MTAMQDPADLSVESAARTHVGLVRKINEDAILELPAHGLWAVADGMGGHAAGDYASQSVVEALKRILPPEGIVDFARAVQHTLQTVNDQLLEEAGKRSRGTIGATVVVLLAADDGLACLWAGDSRLYQLRRGQIGAVSRDHSYVQELLDAGAITPAQAEHHPMGNVVTRAVGAHEQLLLEARPVRVEAGDTLLLCSDGLTKTMSDEEIGALLAAPNIHEAAEALVDLALQRGGPDNISVVIVRVSETDPAAITRPVWPVGY